MTVSLTVNFPNAGATLSIDTDTTKYNSPDLAFPNNPDKTVLFYDPITKNFYKNENF